MCLRNLFKKQRKVKKDLMYIKKVQNNARTN